MSRRGSFPSGFGGVMPFALHALRCAGLVLCVAFAFPTGARAETGPEGSSRPRVGDKAPTFSLKTVDKGEALALDRLVRTPQTQGVAVVFVSCKCPYVAQARQPLTELFQRFGAKVGFIGVNANQNETVDEMKADAAHNFPFPILRDEGAKVADLFAAERTPEVFLIDAKGVIRYHGGVSDLGAALADFTAGRAPTKPEAKAFGCTIKRKT